MTAATDGGEATDAANGDLTGTTFAGREIHSAVGRDLVSTRYLASEPEPDDETCTRRVALRVVAADLCAGEDDDRRLYEQFHHHAAQALTFEHLNAPVIEEVGEHLGVGYLVTAPTTSITLGAYIDRVGPLDLTAALSLFEQVADVLDAGHRAGLTHGAVSPSTLRIAADTVDDDVPKVQLTGHGIGALLELRIRRDRKRLDVVDELLYVAPEQLRQQPSTGRTDQYAMACALVHALSGAPPFVRTSVGGLFGAHLFVEPRLDDNEAAGPRLDDNAAWPAIRKALSKEPRARYATCGQLIADIERAQRSAANRRRAAARRRHVDDWSAASGDAANGAVASPTETVASRPSAPPPADPAPSRDPVHDDREPDPGPAASGHNGVARPDESAEERIAASAASIDVGEAEQDRPGDLVNTDGPRGNTGREPRETTNDKSSTARRRTAAMSYPSQVQGPANGAAVQNNKDELDDVPLLSEVLSRRPPGTQQAAWRPSGVWLAVTILLLVAAAAMVWLIGT